MFSYRHAFHAGNHADVLKHTTLIATLQYLTQKDAGLTLIDTHAGAGLYRLDSDFSETGGEARDGIFKLMTDQRPASPDASEKTARPSAERSDNAMKVDTSAIQDYLDLITSLFQHEDAEILKVEILVRTATRGVRLGVAEETAVVEAAPQAQPRRTTGGLQPVANAIASIAPAAQPRAHAGPLFGSPLDQRYTFDAFVEGTSNRVALAAARTIAEAHEGALTITDRPHGAAGACLLLEMPLDREDTA